MEDKFVKLKRMHTDPQWKEEQNDDLERRNLDQHPCVSVWSNRGPCICFIDLDYFLKVESNTVGLMAGISAGKHSNDQIEEEDEIED